MRILIYQPYNQIVNYIESVAAEFVQQGHEVFFLSHSPYGATHKNLEQSGVKILNSLDRPGNWVMYYIHYILGIAKICRDLKVEIVYSHFQEANIISVFAQFFCKAVFVITRHHSDCAFLDNNRKERLADIIINRLAKIYIAPSRMVFDQIVLEGGGAKKVRLIPYGYNFASFPNPDPIRVKEIRKEFPATFLLVMAARFISEKRHGELIESMLHFKRHKYDTKLLLLGSGPLEKTIHAEIIKKGLSNEVVMLGFKSNILDYYAASDLVVHFSISEASNSAIKEAAYAGAAVAVCKNVGDFSDYIRHGENGFLLSKENPACDFDTLMESISTGKYDLKEIGAKLRTEVLHRFDVSNVMPFYNVINESLKR